MRATIMYAAPDVHVDERDKPTIQYSTHAIIKLSAACVCGSDLRPYRGTDAIDQPVPVGHEYVGIADEVGSDVKKIQVGQFDVGSFFASDNTCEICQSGYQSSCVHREGIRGAQAGYLRILLADGTLVATPDLPDADKIPSLLAASDVLGTGWFGAKLNEPSYKLFRPDLENPSREDYEIAARTLNKMPTAGLDPVDNVVLYFVSESGRFVTGTTHVADADGQL